MGLDVIDAAFEKINLGTKGDSDSEGEDERFSMGHVLEPKDPYLHRPLPFLIGSQDFMDHDEVGLREYFTGIFK